MSGRYGRSVGAYFFFVFFAAFGFAAALDVGFFALRFAVIGMRECSLLQGPESAPRALNRLHIGQRRQPTQHLVPHTSRCAIVDRKKTQTKSAFHANIRVRIVVHGDHGSQSIHRAKRANHPNRGHA